MPSPDGVLEPDPLYQEVFQSAPRPMWIYDLGTLRFLDVNRAAVDWYGYSREEFLGMTIREVVLPSVGVELATIGLKSDISRHVIKDGSLIDVEVTSSDIIFRGQRARVMAPADITERLSSERTLTAQLGITRALADAQSLEDAAPWVLEAICTNFGWEFGALWKADSASGLIGCLELWSDVRVAGSRFYEATKQLSLPSGKGLTGKVWATGDAAWVVDVVNEEAFERRDMARDCGLHGAFAFPLALGDDVGVLEFFGPQPRHPEEAVIRMTASVASQISQFVESKRSENAIRQSEAHKTAIMDSALDAIISFDGWLNIAGFNPAAEKMFGYERDEVIGRSFVDLLTPREMRSELHRAFEGGLSSRFNERVEMTMIRFDGTAFPVEFAATAVELQTGRFFTAYIHDITDRKRGEEAIQKSELRKGAILDSALDAIVTVDQNLNIVEFNPAAEMMFGFKREEVLGKAALERFAPEELRVSLLRELERFRQTGTSPMLNRRIELTALRADGTPFPVEYSVTAVAQPEGHYFTNYIHDITDRRRREAEIRASEAKYRGLMEQASDGILLLEVTGRFIDCNARLLEMTGYSREELLQFTLSDVLTKEQLANLPNFLKEVRKGKASLFERTLLRRNGEKYPVETSVGLTEDGHVLAIVREITERKRAEREMRATLEELRQTDAERRRLLSNLVGAQEEERRRIAADIHDDSIQVMIALGMQLELLTRSIVDTDLRAEIEGARSVVLQAVDRLRLVLFDLHQPNLAAGGVGSALRAHLDQLQSDSGVECSLEDDLVTEPAGDVATILYRVGQEALANIRKHAKASRVDMSLGVEEGGYLLKVSDDGVGFSVDDHDVYVQGHLGMHAMRERVEMAGGRLEIVSMPGVGSQLSFWLPARRESDTAVASVPSIDLVRDSGEVSPLN